MLSATSAWLPHLALPQPDGCITGAAPLGFCFPDCFPSPPSPPFPFCSFFSDYKLNENKKVVVGEYGGVARGRCPAQLKPGAGAVHSACHPPTLPPTLAPRAEDFLGAADAKRVIQDAMDMYTDLFVPKRQRQS